VWQFCKEADHLRTTEPASQDDVALYIHTVHLGNVLCDVEVHPILTGEIRNQLGGQSWLGNIGSWLIVWKFCVHDWLAGWTTCILKRHSGVFKSLARHFFQPACTESLTSWHCP
jgi:hypothetical protein